MKQFLSLACLCVLSAACFAQTPPTPPTLTPDQKLAIREAQHKLDGVEKQQSQLALQIADVRDNITRQQQQFAKSHDEAQAALDKATKEATAGIDFKKWHLNSETLTLTAVPPPPETPNASAQPAKPAAPATQAKK